MDLDDRRFWAIGWLFLIIVIVALLINENIVIFGILALFVLGALAMTIWAIVEIVKWINELVKIW